MINKKPPFEITEKIMNYVIEIAELVGRIDVKHKKSLNPVLRKTNRIRTVYSTLAIEQNTLDLSQVTAVLSGKRVIAPPKDIAEVKNAYEIYECMNTLNPYSAEDLLKAHSVMVRGLEEESGKFRSRPVGIANEKGNIIHFGTLPQYVPELVAELLEWTKNSDFHILIKSCVFHYEFELIHPFSDGNGRMGRLWHTLLLSKWNDMFAWIPIESVICNNQKEYYDATAEAKQCEYDFFGRIFACIALKCSPIHKGLPPLLPYATQKSATQKFCNSNRNNFEQIVAQKMKQGLSPCEDDKPKYAKIILIWACSHYFASAEYFQ